jgi:hypothetical protein
MGPRKGIEAKKRWEWEVAREDEVGLGESDKD